MLNVLMGMAGEEYAKSQLMRMGYVVTYPTEKKQGDLRVKDPATGEVVRVEIKTARRGKDGWQFCLNRWDGTRSKTDCTQTDITILQLVGDSGLVMTYAIPSALLAGIKKTSFRRITPTARNRWAGYLSDYRIFGGVA
jgi:hypothetical protein